MDGLLEKSTINVLIIDDSAFMRRALETMLNSDPGIRVIDTAQDGEEGFAKVKELHPDIVTLDIEMSGTKFNNGRKPDI